METYTFMPKIASNTRSSSGKAHWSSCSSVDGTFSTSYNRYAMATQRKLQEAISPIAFLKNLACKPRKISPKQ